MKNPCRAVPLFVSLLCALPARGADVVAVDPDFARCISSDAKVEKLAGDLQFIEGPVWLKKEAALVFSDIPADALKKWTRAGGVTTFRSPSRNANGNTLDAAGRLLTCEHSGRDRKSTRLNSSHIPLSRMPSSA